MERLSATIQETREGGEPGEFSAIAASLGVASSAQGPTKFTPEALAAAPQQVPLLWMHDTTQPLGLVTLVFDPKEGLVARGKLALGLQRAREARALLMQGALNGVSVGFTARRQRMDKGIRLVDAADIQEVSLVTFPADPCATVRWVHRGVAAEDIVEYFSPRASAKREYELIKLLQAQAAARPDNGAW